jgi:hypothetical protein
MQASKGRPVSSPNILPCKGSNYMITAFPRRIGVILLQAILAVLVMAAIEEIKIPLVAGIISALVIGQLIVVLSNLKMRYWFPSLPIYIAIGSFSFGPPNFNAYDFWHVMLSAIVLAAIQIIIMIVLTLFENSPKYEHSLLRTLYDACFAKGAARHENLFALPKDAYLPILLQMGIYIYCNINSSYFVQFIFLLLLLLPFVSILFKIKLGYFVLSFGISGIIEAFVHHYYFYDINVYPAGYFDLYESLYYMQIMAISAYFVYRFFKRFKKLRKAASKSDRSN